MPDGAAVGQPAGAQRITSPCEARAVVVTRSRASIVVAPAGAVVRGPGLRLAAAGARDPATVLGTVLAQLAGTDFYPAAIAVALR